MKQTLDIFHTEDGFYVGRMCKNGKPAKGAYKVKGDDIMTMFTRFFNDYCADTKNDRLVMEDGQGRMVVTALIKTEKVEQSTNQI